MGDFNGQPRCTADKQSSYDGDPHTLRGTLFRVTSCEILYGPLNCGFVLTGENWCAPPVLRIAQERLCSSLSVSCVVYSDEDVSRQRSQEQRSYVRVCVEAMLCAGQEVPSLAAPVIRVAAMQAYSG